MLMGSLLDSTCNEERLNNVGAQSYIPLKQVLLGQKCDPTIYALTKLNHLADGPSD